MVKMFNPKRILRIEIQNHGCCAYARELFHICVYSSKLDSIECSSGIYMQLQIRLEAQQSLSKVCGWGNNFQLSKKLQTP